MGTNQIIPNDCKIGLKKKSMILFLQIGGLSHLRHICAIRSPATPESQIPSVFSEDFPGEPKRVWVGSGASRNYLGPPAWGRQQRRLGRGKRNYSRWPLFPGKKLQAALLTKLPSVWWRAAGRVVGKGTPGNGEICFKIPMVLLETRLGFGSRRGCKWKGFLSVFLGGASEKPTSWLAAA